MYAAPALLLPRPRTATPLTANRDDAPPTDAWAATELRAKGWFSEVVCRTFPDPHRAREKIWVPFLQKQCACVRPQPSPPPLGPRLSRCWWGAQDANTVLVGHSSGAVAAMRLLEKTPLLGAVLVSACHTDLGDAGERACAPHTANLPTLPT